MQKREPATGRRASQCECGGCRACESESWVWRVGDLKEKGFLSRPMWYRREGCVTCRPLHQLVAFSTPSLSTPQNIFILLFTYPETCTCETHFIMCSCYLALGNLKMAHQKVIRDETSTKRASDGLLFCSFQTYMYLIWTGYAIAVSAMIDLPSGIPLWICMRTCLSERVLISALPFAFPGISGIVCLYPGYLIRQ